MRLIHLFKSFTFLNTSSFLLGASILYALIISARSWQTLMSFFQISDSWLARLQFWFAVLVHPSANFDSLSILVLVAFSLLAAFQAVLWGKLYIRQKNQTTCEVPTAPSKLSVLGGLAALIGVGCAACGAALLVSFLGLFGLTSLILLLPLHGVEIGIVGIVILLYTSYRLLQNW